MVPPIAAATVPVEEVVADADLADREVQVRVHVDAAGNEQPARAVDDVLRRVRARASAATAAIRPSRADAQVGAALAVDVEHGPAAQQHGVRVHRDGVADRIHRGAVPRRRAGTARARPRSRPRARPGSTVDFGPFGSSVEGDDDQVLAAADAVVRAAIGAAPPASPCRSPGP